MERLRQQQEALRAAHQRNEKDLASFPQVLVEHPDTAGPWCGAGATARRWSRRRCCGA